MMRYVHTKPTPTTRKKQKMRHLVQVEGPPSLWY
jgi:hypothetical protein